ncbi:MAG: CRISPR system Cmr subunit Cmr1-1 [Euryarchaeota archaeon ADurb.Bin190]|nr:MAG: CRISPR system Cmr subunit Cmr1-1 [Euryarchaeota archaeon ADurb.Bin190]
MDITKLEADFRIVTPLFMGGADPTVPELRVPGIKGVLRFWWRALAYGKNSGDLEKIKELEGQIFGSTKHGQSRVIMEVSQNEQEPNDDQFFRGFNGLAYLGYGPIDRGVLIRNYLKPPIDATLNIHIITNEKDDKGLGNSEIAENISFALITMGLFGGLGSRSRRGFGSFNILDLKRDGNCIFEQPGSLDDLKKQIWELFKKTKRYRYEGIPKYTAFSSETSVYAFNDVDDNPYKLLDSVGQSMQKYRIGIRDRRGLVKRNFPQDTQLAKDALNSKVLQHPKRIFFGLPHNYHFPKLAGFPNGASLDVKPKKHNRRASPLFIHIQELRDRNYAAVATLMPAIFLPDGEIILMKRQKKEGESSQEPTASEVRVDARGSSLNVIRDFMDSDSKWEQVIPA